MVGTLSGRASWGWFLGLAGAVLATSWVAASTAAFAREPNVMGLAVAIDMCVLVPGMYWWLVVRRGGAPRRTMIPITALSIVVAGSIVPGGGVLSWARLLVAPAELALLAYVVWKAQGVLRAGRARAGEDLVDAMEAAFGRALGMAGVARFLASEFGAMYYGVFARRASVVEGEAFAVKRSGRVLAVLGPLVAFETVLVHVLVMRWSAGAAWALTGLSVYSMLWVLGDHRAMGLRPTVARGDGLDIRVGLRARVRVGWEQIARVERVDWREGARVVQGRLNAAAPGMPNVVVTFTAPVRARRWLGMEKVVESVGLEMEEAERFVEVVRGRLGAARGDAASHVLRSRA